jgi:large repetitive protein
VFISTSQTDPFTESPSGNDLTFTTFVDRPATATIKKHPKRKGGSDKAKFKFSADETGVTFACQLDRRKAKPCNSPVTFKKLKDGKHRFTLSATDTAGSVSPPAVFKWRVQRP